MATLSAAWTAAADEQAPTDDEVQAEKLFREGQHLFRMGKFARACAKFEASLALFDGVGSRGRLAECYERIGRVASAWRLYQEVKRLSLIDGNEERVALAEQRIRQLAERLPVLTIELRFDERFDGLRVTRNERQLESNELGSDLIVDPGTHVIVVSAPGYKTFKAVATIAEAESRVVEVPPLEAIPGSRELEERAVLLRGSPVGRTIAYTLLGLSGAALIGGASFGTMAMLDNSDIPDDCRNSRALCTQEQDRLYESARTNGTRATYSMIIGGSLLTAGLIVWRLSRPRVATERRYVLQWTPTASPDSIGWALSGSF
ncbi:MAG: hypothetical protein AAGC55_00490 [Myxococcota bacterium]